MGLLDIILRSLASDDDLREKKSRISSETDWMSGSILDGDFDDEIAEIDAIDDELDRRNRRRAKKQSQGNGSYGVHREHGWYLPNDDDDDDD